MRPAEGYLKIYFDGLGRNADNTKAAAAPQPKNIQLSAEPGMSNMTASQMTDSRAPAAVTAAMPGRLRFRRSSMAQRPVRKAGRPPTG